MRIGHGYDVHRFKEGPKLVIGGVHIPHTRGLEAHSDGDVLIHAMCDAILGAAGLWDIGHHFPDTDQSYAGIDSRILLRRVIADVYELGLQIANIDSTVVAERPKLSPYIPQMRELLAEDMHIAIAAINIKATTTEKLGFVGREEGIAAHAVVLLERASGF
jgi:2-C-methyl-D-erythritol 2,4-cyclodiphosphate synthase